MIKTQEIKGKWEVLPIVQMGTIEEVSNCSTGTMQQY
jgi:hypothetical protein